MCVTKLAVGLIAVSSVILYTTGANAQAWRSFKTADGLAGNHVTCMLDDQHGNLWFGTEYGLNQYNGLFTTHLDEAYTGKGINIVESLLESSDGKIWAGTWAGLYSYDGAKWQEHMSEISEYDIFILCLLESSDGKIWAGGTNLYSYDGIKWQELLGGSIYFLLESSDGKIWAGTWYDGLRSYDGATWQEHLSGMHMCSLLESQDGTIWAGTLDGLYSYDGAKWQSHLDRMPIDSLMESSDGKIWAGTSRQTEWWWYSLHSFDGTEWQGHLGEVRINSLLESSNGDIWAGLEGGLYTFDGIDWTYHEALMGSSIQQLLESRDYMIWISTMEHGVYRYSEAIQQKQNTRLYTGDFSLRISILESSDSRIWFGTRDLYSYDWSGWQKRLSEVGVNSLLESSDGMIWMGTWGDGLYSYDGREWTKQEQLIMVDIVYKLLESENGTIWVASWKGLYSYDGKKWQKHLDTANSVMESSNGTIWVDTFAGLYSYDGTKWQEHLEGIYESPTSGTSDPGPTLLESSDGRIWIGTADGLYSYDGTEWNKHLAEISVNSLLESSDGRIWVATFENGVYRYNGAGWQRYLEGMTVNHLMENSNGGIWAGTQGNGVQIYDGTEAWQSLTTSDGLISNTVFLIFEDSKGNLWFGMDNGVGVYICGNNPPVIEIMEPQKRAIEIGESAIFIEWRSGDKETETQFLNYQYRIDDDSWSRTTPANFMTTPSMDDGKHTFYVRAIDGDLNYSEPVTLSITVDTIQPTATINFPARGARVSGSGGGIKVVGTATDSDFSGYTVECQSHAAGDWILIGGVSASDLPDPSGVRNGMLATWDVAELKPGAYTLRLTVRDKLDHERSDTVTVEMVSAVKEIVALEGGHVGSGGLDLYIPPRALEGDEEITMTMLSRERLDEPALAGVSRLPSDIVPTNIFLELKSEGPGTPILRKPATITIPYSEEDIIGVTDERRLSLFLWEEEAEEWQKIGGTVYTSKNTIKAAITRLSVLAVVEDRRAFAGEPSISRIHCQPRVFSPNMDGDSPRVYSIRTHISFNVDQESTVTIKIYDMDGRLRRTLIKEEWVSQGIQVFLWDGRDDAQEVLPSGLYFVVVKAGDQTGTKTVVIQNR